MKYLVFIGIILLNSSWFTKGQGYFEFRNYDAQEGIDAPIYDSDGTALYGTTYMASLYGGLAQNTLEEAYSSTLNVPLRVSFTYVPPNGQHGYFRAINTLAVFNSIAPGERVWLQVRAWDARLGNSYEEVFAKGLGGYGASTLFQEVAAPIWLPITPLSGLQSFSLVPEPSSGILLLGALIYLLNKMFRMKCTWD